MIGSAAAIAVLLAADPPARSFRVPVATLAEITGDVAIAEAADWKAATRGQRVRTGDKLRTGPASMAHLNFPWTSLRIGADTVLAIPPSSILAVDVERGRVEQESEGAQTVRLQTQEAVVRGEGRVILRRGVEGTAVTVVSGNFRIEGRLAANSRIVPDQSPAPGVTVVSGNEGRVPGNDTVEVRGGQSSLIVPGQPPAPAMSAPPKPSGLLPGADPLYVVAGDSVVLHWTPRAPWHHVQVLAIDTNELLVDRDVDDPPPYTLKLPWLGTYRWRVAAGGAGGVEGLPSEEGLICIVEK